MNNNLEKEAKADNRVKDIIEFIFHKIVIGYIVWILVCYFISYQKFIMGKFNEDEGMIGGLFCIFQLVIFAYFINRSIYKNAKKIFGDYTYVVAVFITVITCCIIYAIFGIKTVIF